MKRRAPLAHRPALYDDPKRTMHRPQRRLPIRLGLAVLLLAGVVSVPRDAFADGVLIGPSDLGTAGAGALDALVAKAKKDVPDSFAAVARVRGELAELDARKRGPYAPLGRLLKDLGPEAVPALLEAVALDAGAGRSAKVPSSPPGGLTESAWLAWRVGLLEAIGAHRDARSEATLWAVLDHRADAESPILRAAAAAYGKLGSAEAVRRLASLAQADDARGRAALHGLGHARTEASARALAAALVELPGGERARTIVHALGDVGSAWAWQAIARRPRGANPKEADAVRGVAVEALADAFVPYGPTTRKEIERALLVIDDPRAVAALERHKRGADQATVEAIDALLVRLAKGPRGR